MAIVKVKKPTLLKKERKEFEENGLEPVSTKAMTYFLEMELKKDKTCLAYRLENKLAQTRTDITRIEASGLITGIEIKSDGDSLSRLDDQVEIYSKFFDFCYLAVGHKLRHDAVKKLPWFWGVYLIERRIGGKIEKSLYRKPFYNQRHKRKVERIDYLCELWKVEKIEFLKGEGIKLPSNIGSYELNDYLEDIPLNRLRDFFERSWRKKIQFPFEYFTHQ